MLANASVAQTQVKTPPSQILPLPLAGRATSHRALCLLLYPDLAVARACAAQATVLLHRLAWLLFPPQAQVARRFSLLALAKTTASA